MKQVQNSFGPLRSLRIKMLLWAFVFILPILVILCSSINSAIQSVDEQTRHAIDQLLTPFTAEIDATLSVAKRYIANINIDLFALSDPKLDELASLEAVQAVGHRISQDLAVYPQIDAVFLSSASGIRFVMNYNRSYALSSKAAQSLRRALDGRTPDTILFQQGYMTFEADGHCFFYIALDVPGGVVGCWFDAATLVEPTLRANLNGLVRVVFSDRNRRMLDPEFSTPSAKQLDRHLAPYFVSTRQLTAAPFEMNVLWNRDVVFAPISQMRRSVFTTISVAILLFSLYVVFLRTSLIRPLNRLVNAIHGIRQGNLGQIPLNKNEDVEIANVYHALNDMTNQIKSLRIRMYEETLIKQKTQMQLYQLQLRPHFFLNALNTIVSFARIKDYEMVQKMAMYLATHCRYILYNPWYVTVEEELIYTQNFVDMQSTQHNAAYRYCVNAKDEVLDMEIPILAVQIFVENALKHAHAQTRPIEISVAIEACMDEDRPCLHISIDDTGTGFDQEALVLLNSPEIPMLSSDDHGIGISNVRHRLRILYGDSMLIRFSNRTSGGAHVEMLLPMDGKEGGHQP